MRLPLSEVPASAPFLLDLGVNYVPPKPQLAFSRMQLFSRDDDEAVDELDHKTWLMPSASSRFPQIG